MLFESKSILITNNDFNQIASTARCILTKHSFAVGCNNSKFGYVQVYQTSTLCYEFRCIYAKIHHLYYTFYSDSIITIESNEQQLYLCVYHDWRNRNMVRAFELPLAAHCAKVAVCGYSGRIAVCTESLVNVWQCNNGFFEHVYELETKLKDIQYLAIHGSCIAFGTCTEMRAMSIDVCILKQTGLSKEKMEVVQRPTRKYSKSEGSAKEYTQDELYAPSCDSSILTTIGSDEFRSLELPFLPSTDKSSIKGDDEMPYAPPGDAELSQLVQRENIRVNESGGYHISANGIMVLLRRYQPEHRKIKSLHFLPETVGNNSTLESQKSTRLLITTEFEAIIFYILVDADDDDQPLVTRNRSASRAIFAQRNSKIESTYYDFAAYTYHVTANTSYLFANTSLGIQVWSIWSPCRHVAANKAMAYRLVPKPDNPILIAVQQIQQPLHCTNMIALDTQLVLLYTPDKSNIATHEPSNEAASSTENKMKCRGFEFKASHANDTMILLRSVVVHTLLSPSKFYACMQQQMETLVIGTTIRANLLLSMFSLFRFRADITASRLHSLTNMEKKVEVLSKMNASAYRMLAKECATDLATIYLSSGLFDIFKAANLFAVSSVPVDKVLQSIQKEKDNGQCSSEDALEATAMYLEAAIFPSTEVEVASIIQPPLTQHVLQYFGSRAPATLARIVVDSSLQWNASDISLAYHLLSNPEANCVQSIQARLTLLERMDNILNAELPMKNEIEVLDSNSRRKAVESELAMLRKTYSNGILELYIAHPELLFVSLHSGKTIEPSLTAKLLLQSFPSILLSICCHLVTVTQSVLVANRVKSVINTQRVIQLHACLLLFGAEGLVAGTNVDIDSIAHRYYETYDFDMLVYIKKLLHHFVLNTCLVPSKKAATEFVYVCLLLMSDKNVVLCPENANTKHENQEALPTWMHEFMQLFLDSMAGIAASTQMYTILSSLLPFLAKGESIDGTSVLTYCTELQTRASSKLWQLVIDLIRLCCLPDFDSYVYIMQQFCS